MSGSSEMSSRSASRALMLIDSSWAAACCLSVDVCGIIGSSGCCGRLMDNRRLIEDESHVAPTEACVSSSARLSSGASFIVIINADSVSD